MRRPLVPLLALFISLLVIGVLAVIAAVPPSDDSNPSSRSAGKLGSLAIYTWFDRLGLDVARLSGDFALGGTDLLVEYDPTIAFTTPELDAVIAFLHGGGTLLLAFDGATVDQAAPLLDRLGVQIDATADAGTASPAQPFDPAGRTRSVPVGPGFALLDQLPLVPLLRESGGVVAGVAAAGSGRAFVLGDSQPLSNDGLRHDDAPYFVLNVLARARGGRIAFDEVHHGEGGGGGAAAIFNGSVGLAAVLAAALAVAALALNGRRVGRPVVAGDDAAVPSATAYVQAMGGLFARSRRRGMIASRYAAELKQRLGDLSGVAAHLDDGMYAAALAAAGEPRAGDVGALLARARALEAGHPDERSLLQLARDVDAMERGWSSAEWRP